MKARLLLPLIQLFPRQYRATRGEELTDAISAQDLGWWATGREAIGLVWAATTAWRRYLATAAGLRASLFAGAVSWAVLLISAGPVIRAITGQPFWQQESGVHLEYGIAAALCLAGIASIAWGRLAAIVTIGSGVVAAGYANHLVTGLGWRWSAATAYEVKWIGVAALAAILLRPQNLRRGWFCAWITLGVAVALAVCLPAWDATWNYGRLFQYNLQQGYMDALGGFADWVSVSLVLIALAAPWVARAFGAYALPALVHMTLLQPWPALAAVAYVVAVPTIQQFWTHYKILLSVSRRHVDYES